MCKRQIILVILFLEQLTFCTSYGQAINGSGKIVKTAIPMIEFSAVRLKSSSNIIFVESDKKEIAIEADEKFMPYIECVVTNGCLTVKNKNGAWFNLVKPINIFVPINNSLTKIINNGSGDIYSDKLAMLRNDLAIISNASGNVMLSLNCNNLEVNKSGSSAIILNGKVNHLSLQSGGNGELDASKLMAQDIDVKLRGNSEAKLRCASSVHTDLRGNSSVSIIGNPKITSIQNSRDNIHLVKE